MKALLILITCGFFFMSIKPIDKDKIVGVWKLSKHTYIIKEIINDKIKDVEKQCDFYLHFPILQLSKDSTYSIKLKGKLIEMGKWSFRNPGSILFYQRKDMPDDPGVILGDRAVGVMSVKSSELVLKEHQCSEKFEGESVYESLK